MSTTATLLTSQVIVNELLRRFKNNLVFTAGARKGNDESDRFATPGAYGKIGDTLNLRIPVRFGASDGATLVQQDVTELKVPLVINKQKHVGFSFSSKDLTLTIDRFRERYLDGAALALANQVDVDGITAATQAAFSAVGTPGTIPTALKTYNYGSALLDKNGCPFDENRSVIITPDMNVEIVDSLKGLFQSSEKIKQQYTTGRMGTAAGLDWASTQNCLTQTYGPQGGVPAVDGGGGKSVSGSKLSTKAWALVATPRLALGDVFTIAGVYMVNPVSKATIGTLQQFTVTAAFSSLADGTGDISISPAIVGPPVGPPGTIAPTQNVSALPVDGAPLTIAGAASTISPQGLIYHRDAIAFAMVPMEMPNGVHFAARQTDKSTGMSIRIVSQYDISSDLFITRCDIMYGWAVPIAQWLCRVQS